MYYVRVGFNEVFSVGGNEVYSVYVRYNSQEFLLGSLAPGSAIYQVPVNVEFEKGAQLELYFRGGTSNARVHLTGYVLSGTSSTAVQPTTVSSPARNLPINAQQSILVSNKKSVPKNEQKRVSIQAPDAEEDKNQSDDEDENEDEENENSEDETDDSDEDDDAQVFDLLDSGDEDEDDEDSDQIELDDSAELQDEEEPSFLGETINNGGEAGSKLGKKKKKARGSKLDGSAVDESTPKSSKQKGTPITPPSKKFKLDSSKDKIDPMKTPEPKAMKLPSSAGNTPMKTLTKGRKIFFELEL